MKVSAKKMASISVIIVAISFALMAKSVVGKGGGGRGGRGIGGGVGGGRGRSGGRIVNPRTVRGHLHSSAVALAPTTAAYKLVLIELLLFVFSFLV